MAPQIDNKEIRIKKSLEKVEGKILALVNMLKTNPEGFLLTSAINLKAALSLRTEILKAFNPYFKEAKTTTNFRPILKDLEKRFSKAGISVKFLRIDTSLIKAFSNDAFWELSSLGVQYSSAISEQVYLGAAVGDSVKEITDTVSQLLLGGKDKVGRPLAAHATTIVETRYMEADSSVLLRKAEEYNINLFKYQGSLIKDSRKWCQDHKDKIYTLEEIKAWNDTKWQGKKEGDPFVTRGGWRCRHFWTPVKRKEEE
ncbi:hypothetical protein KAR91_82920 [Candidatus Pacearchaeota archaeon]|nr:hypothetical protein [Candidatus Pacearchaeota archaeon]